MLQRGHSDFTLFHLVAVFCIFQIPDVVLDGRLLESGQTVRLLHCKDGRRAGCLGHPVQTERPHTESQGALMSPYTCFSHISMAMQMSAGFLFLCLCVVFRCVTRLCTASGFRIMAAWWRAALSRAEPHCWRSAPDCRVSRRTRRVCWLL